MKTIEQIKEQCMFAGKLDKEQQYQFAALEDLFLATQNLLGEMKDCGEFKDYSFAKEVEQCLGAVEMGTPQVHQIYVEVTTSLSENETQDLIQKILSEQGALEKVSVSPVEKKKGK